MSPNQPLAPGQLHSSLVDQDIAHIRRVMPLSLRGDFGGPIFPAPYWRRRLTQLLDRGYASKGQLAQIDSLLALLDEFERDAMRDAAESRPPIGEPPEKR